MQAIQDEVQILRGALPGFMCDSSYVVVRRGDLLGDAVSNAENLTEF